MEKKHLTDDEIREAFAKFADDLRSADPQHQITSAKTMLNVMNDYLHQNIERLDTTAILLFLEELNNIGNGNKARFIKSKFEGGGRPLDAGKNTQQAALCAGIQMLINHHITPKEAISLVSQWSGWPEKKLRTLRADFKKSNKSRDATDLMWQFIQNQKEQNLDPTQQAKSLVAVAMTIGEKPPVFLTTIHE